MALRDGRWPPGSRERRSTVESPGRILEDRARPDSGISPPDGAGRRRCRGTEPRARRVRQDERGHRGRGGGAGNFPATPKWRFVFVNHVTTNPFFTPTQYGAEDASALLGTTFQWTGSKTADVGRDGQRDEHRDRGQGRTASPSRSSTRRRSTGRPSKALAAGIPVVSYNADDPANARLAYIGQDLFVVRPGDGQADRRAGRLRARSRCSSPRPGSLNIQPRIDGAIDSIKKSGKDIEYKAIATGAELNEELSRDRRVLPRQQGRQGHVRRRRRARPRRSGR